MLGGVFQILFGVFKFGRYINLVPYPVISGFMSGIGCIIIILAIGPLCWSGRGIGRAVEIVLGVARLVQTGIHSSSLILGVVIALATVWFIPQRLKPLYPRPVACASCLARRLSVLFSERCQLLLAKYRVVCPVLQLPVFSIDEFAMIIIKYSLVLAFLGSIDSLLTSLIADSITRTHHESDRELFGQGIGNVVSGLFGGLPGAGATMRTVVNVRAGGRTPVSGALHALIVADC